MSAIQRDREIAAKATQGEWRNGPSDVAPRPLMTQVRISPDGPMIAECSYLLSYPPLDADYDSISNAEHIVRLHNRQPLYDALVDAVRDFAPRHENPESTVTDARFKDFGNDSRNYVLALLKVVRTLAALDREES